MEKEWQGLGKLLYSYWESFGYGKFPDYCPVFAEVSSVASKQMVRWPATHLPCRSYSFSVAFQQSSGENSSCPPYNVQADRLHLSPSPSMRIPPGHEPRQIDKYLVNSCGLLLRGNIYFSSHGDYKDIVRALAVFLLASVLLYVAHHISSSREVCLAHGTCL